ncbi:hypothetical protein Hanom_Chr04g00313071 [Helianthus anomalus]
MMASSPSTLATEMGTNRNHIRPPTCGLMVTCLGFPTETQVQFSLVSCWGGYWSIMVINPPRGVRS